MTIDGATFRHVMGHYPTGVCAITATVDERPVGMIVGSFTSASLDPPLVGFLPGRRSTTWPAIEATGRFCVNVLSHDQHALCALIAAKAGDPFERVAHRRSAAGLPILDGVVAWIDCALHAVHEAGDHFIVLGAVEALGVETAEPPLVFLRGAYGAARF